jgi:hypothetical protein
MNLNSLIIIIIIILLCAGFMYFISNGDAYVKSSIDQEYYLVRNLPDKQQASDLLARIKQNIFIFTNHLYINRTTNYSKYKSYIEALNDRIQNVILEESSEYSLYTSYSVNKGKKIVFCLRSKSTGKLYDINLLMYVALHEVAHIACPEYGHSKLFIDIFAYLVQIAIQQNIYKKINFDLVPYEYCGLIIRNSVI